MFGIRSWLSMQTRTSTAPVKFSSTVLNDVAGRARVLLMRMGQIVYTFTISCERDEHVQLVASRDIMFMLKTSDYYDKTLGICVEALRKDASIIQGTIRYYRIPTTQAQAIDKNLDHDIAEMVNVDTEHTTSVRVTWFIARPENPHHLSNKLCTTCCQPYLMYCVCSVDSDGLPYGAPEIKL